MSLKFLTAWPARLLNSIIMQYFMKLTFIPLFLTSLRCQHLRCLLQKLIGHAHFSLNCSVFSCCFSASVYHNDVTAEKIELFRLAAMFWVKMLSWIEWSLRDTRKWSEIRVRVLSFECCFKIFETETSQRAGGRLTLGVSACKPSVI